jgi:hypothetical protein
LRTKEQIKINGMSQKGQKRPPYKHAEGVNCRDEQDLKKQRVVPLQFIFKINYTKAWLYQ